MSDVATGPWSKAELEDKLAYLIASRAYDLRASYAAGGLVEVKYTQTNQRGRRIWTILSIKAPDAQEVDVSP